jgi:tetratricopeptide (TPR) repeat protein
MRHQLTRTCGWLTALFVGAGLLLAAPQPTASSGQSRLSEAGRRAVALLNEENLAGALEALEGRASTPVDKALLGTLYLELRRPAEAAAILGPMADEASADAAVLYNAGRAASALGRIEKAEEYFERSVALIGVSPAARELGLLRGAQRDFFEAYRLLGPWLETHPNDEEARLAAAACALQLSRTAEAEPLVAGLSSDEPRAVFLRGQLRRLSRTTRRQWSGTCCASPPTPTTRWGAPPTLWHC